jgi:hypothetical protein
MFGIPKDRKDGPLFVSSVYRASAVVLGGEASCSSVRRPAHLVLLAYGEQAHQLILVGRCLDASRCASRGKKQFMGRGTKCVECMRGGLRSSALLWT